MKAVKVCTCDKWLENQTYFFKENTNTITRTNGWSLRVISRPEPHPEDPAGILQGAGKGMKELERDDIAYNASGPWLLKEIIYYMITAKPRVYGKSEAFVKNSMHLSSNSALLTSMWSWSNAFASL